MELSYEEVTFNVWLHWDKLFTSEQLEELEADYWINIMKSEWN